MRLPALLGMGGLLSAFLLNFDPSGTVNATDSTTPVDGKASLSLELIDEAGVQWQIPAGTTKLSVLAVGGGGGGAPGLGNAAGGGGAGGLVFVENYLEKFNARPGDAIEVKAGMPGAIPNPHKDRRGLPGSNSSFGKIVALGGGGGGRGQNLEPVHHASSGGSAGGGNMGDKIPVALQPAESGFGIGFGHPAAELADQAEAVPADQEQSPVKAVAESDCKGFRRICTLTRLPVLQLLILTQIIKPITRLCSVICSDQALVKTDGLPEVERIMPQTPRIREAGVAEARWIACLTLAAAVPVRLMDTRVAKRASAAVGLYSSDATTRTVQSKSAVGDACNPRNSYQRPC
jgi:hypothetical protein